MTGTWFLFSFWQLVTTQFRIYSHPAIPPFVIHQEWKPKSYQLCYGWLLTPESCCIHLSHWIFALFFFFWTEVRHEKKLDDVCATRCIMRNVGHFLFISERLLNEKKFDGGRSIAYDVLRPPHLVLRKKNGYVSIYVYWVFLIASNQINYTLRKTHINTHSHSHISNRQARTPIGSIYQKWFQSSALIFFRVYFFFSFFVMCSHTDKMWLS